MKKLKKVLLVLVILFVVLIGTIAALPFIFKGKIIEQVKSVANESVNAKVDFGEFDLSIFSSFPNFMFEINDVSVVGKDQFDGDTLAFVGHLNLELDLNSVFSGDYKVNNFLLKDVVANATVLEDGTANWDIALPDTSAPETPEEHVEEEEGAAAKFGLQNYSIENVNVTYNDHQGNMFAIIRNLNHSGKFHMEGGKLIVDTKTDIDALSYEMDGVKYAKKIKTHADANLEMNLDSMKFKFIENKFSLNKLNLGVDGWMMMGEEDMDFDIQVNALDNKFEEVLSLIPAVYKEDIKGIETKGDFSLIAFLKGKMTDDKLPSYGTSLKINSASFKYPDLPESVEKINVDLNVFNKTGVINDTYVDLNKFKFEIAKSPIDIEFHMHNVEVNPTMRGRVQSKINLENIKKAIPMEDGEDYQGRINANLAFNGKLSYIENEEYDKFMADGQVTLMDVLYKSKDLPTTNIKIAEIGFTPFYIDLASFKANIGKSDIALKGKVENFLPYVFKDDTISGHLSVVSENLDLDELMGDDTSVSTDSTTTVTTSTTDSTQTTASSTEGAVEVPGNIDFILHTNLKKVKYDDMPIDDFEGSVMIEHSKVILHETKMNVLGGSINLEGEYSSQDIKNPFAFMHLGINDMDIPVAFKTFNTVEKLAPIAKNTKGKFTTDLKFRTNLTDSMTPNFPTMQGKGNLFTKELLIEDSKIMTKIADALKNPKLKKIRAEDLKIFYTIKDGKVFVEPFDMKMGTTKATVSGWNSFDQTMKYKFAFKIPRKDLGGEANKLIAGLESQAAALGASQLKVGEFIDVDVFVEGNMDDPTVKVGKLGVSGGEKSLKDQATDKIKDEAAKLKAEAEKKAQEEADRLKAEAEKKLQEEEEKLRKEAEARIKKEQENLKKEAEEKARQEAKKKAGNVLKGFGL